jgi:hypothetical protein
MGRLGFNTRLSHILGSFGGRAQTPEFIQRAFDLARQQQEYTPGAEIIDRPNPVGGGVGDYIGDVFRPGGAASYFDVQGYNRGRTQQRAAERFAPSTEQIQPGNLDLGPQGQTQSLLPSAIRGRQYNLGQPPPDPLAKRGG